MSTITVIGVTGYTGGNIAREAAARGHRVVGVARTVDGAAIDGVELVAGDIADPSSYDALFEGATAVVLAVHHSEPRVSTLVPELLAAATRAGARLFVVGGAGSLLVTADGPRLVETPDFPELYVDEATFAWDTLRALEASTAGSWTYVSPPALYGSWVAGERTGSYRLGGDVLLTDADGKSFIGGADFAIAVVDEIEKPAHTNRRFTVAY